MLWLCMSTSTFQTPANTSHTWQSLHRKTQNTTHTNMHISVRFECFCRQFQSICNDNSCWRNNLQKFGKTYPLINTTAVPHRLRQPTVWHSAVCDLSEHGVCISLRCEASCRPLHTADEARAQPRPSPAVACLGHPGRPPCSHPPIVKVIVFY